MEKIFPEILYVIEEEKLSGTYLIARPVIDAFEPEDTIAIYELKRVQAPLKAKKELIFA